MSKPARKGVEMLVVFNDTQFSRNGDHEAFGAFMKFVNDYKDRITHIVANGDITDYELQSRYAKHPDMYGEAREEIATTQWVFKTLAKLLPRAEKIFIDGNHDHRWKNMVADQTLGLESWVKTPEEMFQLKELGWKHYGYGRGEFYNWHNQWIFYHGSKAAAKSNNAKNEMDDAHLSGTSGHTNRNEFWQQRDAFGKIATWIIHGGFSKDNLGFVKKANSGWNQGFGVYYWSKETGVQPYMILIKHNNPRFIWESKIYDGKGYKIIAK